MRFSSAGLLALAAPLANAAAFSIFDPTQASLNLGVSEDFPVEGDNPLGFCNNPEDYSLEIKSVDLSPNPPKPGTELLITASGTVHETIAEGSYVKLQVKYGLITLITQTIDLCEQLGNVDLGCPVEPGVLTVTKSVDLPKAIPPGTYNVLADVYSDQDTQITCLKASVSFNVGGF